MAKTLKVFGGTIFYGSPRKQVRVLVAAFTKKQAVELLSPISHHSYNEFNTYFGETGNDVELSVATEVGVWVKSNRNDIKAEYYTKL
jgi:hypothetical protein